VAQMHVSDRQTDRQTCRGRNQPMITSESVKIFDRWS